MGPLSTQIDQVRERGISDDQTLDYLSKNRPDLAPQIEQTKQRGLAASAVLDYLKKSDIPPATSVLGMEKLGGQPPAAGQRPQVDALQGQPDALPPGFLESFNAMRPHPIDALKDWWNRPKRLAQASEAARRERVSGDTSTQPDLSLAAGPDSPGALINATVAPAAAAGKQAAEGNFGGAAGSLAGGYGVPAALGAVGGVAPTAGRAIAAGARAGGPEIAGGLALSGAGEIASEVARGAPGIGHFAEWPIRAATLYPGAKFVYSGAKKGLQAAKESIASDRAAAATQSRLARMKAAGSRNPAWQDIQDDDPDNPASPPGSPPSSGQLPSGRTVGGIQNQTLMQSASAKPVTTMPPQDLLDEIAQGNDYKSFQTIPKTPAGQRARQTIIEQARRVAKDEARQQVQPPQSPPRQSTSLLQEATPQPTRVPPDNPYLTAAKQLKARGMTPEQARSAMESANIPQNAITQTLAEFYALKR